MPAPPVTIRRPPAGVRFLPDQEARVRDGTLLRANLLLPEGEGRWPAVICAHPNNLPRRGPQFTYRLMRPRRLSASAPEPPGTRPSGPRGYALVNCDLRGFFRSEGEGSCAISARWSSRPRWPGGRR
ncbi:MAG: CocE/NonD family hydrolase [Candidatus Eremiobacterota bacterium]